MSFHLNVADDAAFTATRQAIRQAKEAERYATHKGDKAALMARLAHFVRMQNAR